MSFSDLPLDVLHPILAHLSDRRDWHTCALVNTSFNQVSTPLLYQKLDSRVKNSKLYHPSQTILHRPELAKYVRHATETGAIHFTYRHTQPTITRDTVHALSLCTNLHSLTWTDDCASTNYVIFSLPNFARPTRQHELSEQHPLLSLLSAIKSSQAPLRELVIRSNSDLGSHVWSELSHWTGLTKIAVWCMDGQPRVLQGWAGKELGRTLRKLELARCAGVPPTIIISVLSQLPLLQELHIKGVQASSVLTILTLLPDLQTLDTEYLNSGSGNIWPRDWPLHLLDASLHSHSLADMSSTVPPAPKAPQLPTLRTLTVRTSSIDSMGPNKLFPWIRALSLNTGLESFRLLTFTTSGYPSIPRGFILGMARLHNTCLRKWIVPSMQMTLSDIECVCTTFVELEEVGCSTAVVVGDVDSIRHSISSANNLHTLRLHVQWIPSTHSQYRSNGHSHHHHSQSKSRSLTPSVSSSPRRSSFGKQQQHDVADPDTDNTDIAHPDTDIDTDTGTNTDTVPHPNYSRHSGDPGAFEFDRVGLRHAGSSKYGADEIEDSHEEQRVVGAEAREPKNGEESTGNGVGRGRGRSHHRRWPFTLEHAKDMMLNDGSKLRVVAVGGVVYTGKWVWDGEKGGKGGSKFEVDDIEEE